MAVIRYEPFREQLMSLAASGKRAAIAREPAGSIVDAVEPK